MLLKGVLCFSNIVSLGTLLVEQVKIYHLPQAKREWDSLLPGPTDIPIVPPAHHNDDKSWNHNTCKLHTYDPDYCTLGISEGGHVQNLRA